jgi:thiamine pyrophosphokinase
LQKIKRAIAQESRQTFVSIEKQSYYFLAKIPRRYSKLIAGGFSHTHCFERVREESESAHVEFSSLTSQPFTRSRKDTATIMSTNERPIVYHKSPLLASAHKRALIILNSPLGDEPSPLFTQLWNSAQVRICADGGANRLRAAQPQWTPDLVVGDLDSLTSETREHYEKMGVTIRKFYDQDKNDLEKALLAAVNDYECSQCCVFGAFGGRFDQVMASMSRLYHWAEEPKLQSLWLYDDYTMAFLLPAHVENHIELALPPLSGDTTIHVGEGQTCGIIPLGAPCESMTLTGFEWNLTDYPSSFNGMVSTSNRIAQEINEPNGIPLSVTVSSPVIFTTEVFCGRSDK